MKRALLAIAVVFVPTSFFIIGEYNALYAAATAAFAIMLTVDSRYRRSDAFVLGALAVGLLLWKRHVGAAKSAAAASKQTPKAGTAVTALPGTSHQGGVSASGPPAASGPITTAQRPPDPRRTVPPNGPVATEMIIKRVATNPATSTF